MVEPIQTSDNEFSAQLQALVIEAGQPRDSRAPAKDAPTKQLPESEINALLRPILDSIETLHRAQSEQFKTLLKLEKLAAASDAIPLALADARQALDSRNAVSRTMFEALHSELKTYKDGFILEAVLRPVIRDLISVYDDMWEIHKQIGSAASAFDETENGEAVMVMVNKMRHAATNLDHNIHFILEVLERLDVSLVPVIGGKLDKRTQKAVALEFTENPDEDQDVVKSSKRGFQWKDRIIRPEEVVIRKWKEVPRKPEDQIVSEPQI
jgi:molecular chaperone GrpE (heat shock protein)